MPDTSTAQPQLITELHVSAHLMQLDAGVYCVSHAPGSVAPDPDTGLPGARLSVPPGPAGRGVAITGFRDDGWLGSLDSAALIRVNQGPAQVLVTIYQTQDSQHEPPHLQVTRLVGGVQTAAAQRGVVPPPEKLADAFEPERDAEDNLEAEIAAHVQKRGDVLARLGEWVGERGSQRWVEGFAVSPRTAVVAPEDIEYQAVLGRGWLSPWAEGGQYCGSRGMALPILGLRVRLRGGAALTHTVQVSATFTDGTMVGPVGAGDPCEAESLAPLEAFRVDVVQLQAKPAPETIPAKPVAKPPVAKMPLVKALPVKIAAKPAVKAAPKPAKSAPPVKPPAKPARPQPAALPKGKTLPAGRGRAR